MFAASKARLPYTRPDLRRKVSLSYFGCHPTGPFPHVFRLSPSTAWHRCGQGPETAPAPDADTARGPGPLPPDERKDGVVNGDAVNGEAVRRQRGARAGRRRAYGGARTGRRRAYGGAPRHDGKRDGPAGPGPGRTAGAGGRGRARRSGGESAALRDPPPLGADRGVRERGPGLSTDDTEYAIFSGLLLARHGSALDVSDVERAWHHWIADLDEGPFRGAFSERGTLENLRRGLAAPISAQHRHAWSDGLAMRAAPFGVFAAGRPAEAARLVAVDGRVSHEGEGIYGGQAVAAGVAAAMVGSGLASVVAAALSVVPMDSWTARSLRRAVAAAQRPYPDRLTMERAVRSAVVIA